MTADKQILMFGMTVEEIQSDYMESITAKFSGLEMVVMGILSDVQHMAEYNYSKEHIRKQLNIAKYILAEMLDKR